MKVGAENFKDIVRWSMDFALTRSGDMRKVNISSKHGRTSLIFQSYSKEAGDDYDGTWMSYSESHYDDVFIDDEMLGLGLEEHLLYACMVTPKKSRPDSI